MFVSFDLGLLHVLVLPVSFTYLCEKDKIMKNTAIEKTSLVVVWKLEGDP